MKPIVALSLLLCVSSAGAQVYKWTDNKGVVHYSDKPHAGAGALAAPSSEAPGPALPYELAQAAKRHPVTLYTTAGCGICDQGRAYLKARGIPFLEKTVDSDADAAKLKEAGGNGQLPLLLVGRSKLTGFEQDSWGGALTAASYPAKSQLPPTYRHRSAQAADPVTTPVDVAPETAKVSAATPATRTRPKKKDNADVPPGFQF